MSLEIDSPLVSIDWLFANLNNEKLVILDCTIPSVTNIKQLSQNSTQIKGAIFFDLKNTFSDQNSIFPNTVLSAKDFENNVQCLGINSNSIIICYDDLGIYSSPRVWWMFQLMGFKDCKVLNGGLPEWCSKNYPIETKKNRVLPKGNFKANYQPKKIAFTSEVLKATKSNNIKIADARSSGRFYATEPEPRNDIKGGHIPNSISMPYTEILENGKIKSVNELRQIFKIFELNDQIIFTCGSGITASILALGAELTNHKNYAVYDGSWTEWGSSENLPIEI